VNDCQFGYITKIEKKNKGCLKQNATNNFLPHVVTNISLDHLGARK
jgi:hypothetical protein